MCRVSWVVAHWAGLFVSFLSVLFFLSGWIGKIPFEPVDPRTWGFLITFLSGAAIAILSGRRLWKQARRELILADTALAVALVGTLGIAEWVGRSHLPPWPQRALHSLPQSEDQNVWERILYYDPKAIGINSWGQRDRERKLAPPPNTPRVAFVGDSYLEASPAIPLPMQIEKQMGDRIEAINLGVSMTNPEDYYWRAKRVALPLESRHVITFYYLGNDLSPPRAARFWEGLNQWSPRPSLAGALLPALSHWTQLRRHRSNRSGWPAAYPDPDAWDLARIRETGPANFKEWLITFYERYGGQESQTLRERLAERDLGGFYEQILQPDGGMFRSSMLLVFLRRLVGETKTQTPEQARPSVEELAKWAEATREACRKEGTGFTAVIIPTAFETDARYRDLWSRLAPFDPIEVEWLKETTQSVAARLVSAGIDTLDLSPALTGTATFLNVDGHFSEAGAAASAAAIATHLRKILVAADRIALGPASSFLLPGR